MIRVVLLGVELHGPSRI